MNRYLELYTLIETNQAALDEWGEPGEALAQYILGKARRLAPLLEVDLVRELFNHQDEQEPLWRGFVLPRLLELRTVLRDMIDESQEQIISSYSRAQALEDGMLVDISEPAGMVGVSHPIAVTAALWHVLEQSGRGALGNLLIQFATSAKKEEGDRFHFVADLGERQEPVWALVGPGDDPKPVITIMLEGED